MSRRTKGLPVLDTPSTPCEPVGDLSPWARCTHPRSCSCGASLHLGPSFEVPGFHSWQWKDEEGRQGITTYPWGIGAAPAGWWEALAERDIARYSLWSAAASLGHFGNHHRHAPGGYLNCRECEPSRPAPDCHGSPMMATVEGWRCREARRVYTAGGATIGA